ncbi:MAG: Ppx/GppA family phosphatase [Candidatus Cloacimonetes bacterium]|nr:Ppx/GppA family phosphatase [Candidatus Cloacimonadota bacterium]
MSDIKHARISQRLAVLEIGTNSLKFLIADCQKDSVNVILDISNISRLGEGLQKTGLISEIAAQRNLQVIRGFLLTAHQYSVHKIYAIGTMCLRSARNSPAFINLIKENTGVNILVLSGDEEAHLTRLAITDSLKCNADELLLIDTGGGSTEFIFTKAQKITQQLSIDLGAIQPTEKFFHHDPITLSEFASARNYIIELLQKKGIKQSSAKLYGSGGTITTMAAMHIKLKEYDPKKIHGCELYRTEIEQIIECLQRLTLEQKKSLPGLQPQRADVILAGCLIVHSILKVTNIEQLTVSTHGIRHAFIKSLS